MKTIYQLFVEIRDGIREKGLKKFFQTDNLVSVYLIVLALGYLTSFLGICVAWYIYELIVLGYLNENEQDTLTALTLSIILMLPVADIFLKKVQKRLT